MAIVSSALNKETQAVHRLTQQVGAHTPSYAAKFLTVVIPVFGWIGGGLYLLYQSYQKSQTLKKLAGAVAALKIEAGTSEPIKKIHRAAMDILFANSLKKKFAAHLKKRDIRFQSEAIVKVMKVFGPDLKNLPNFKREIFPIYLALASRPADQTEALIEVLPDSILASLPPSGIDRNKVNELRTELTRLQTERVNLPKVRGRFSLEKCILDGINSSKKVYDAVLALDENIFEKDVKNGLQEIFGEMWGPEFIKTEFRLYHGIARSFQSDADIKLFCNLPDSLRKIRIPPKEYIIDKDKVIALRNKLKEMDEKLLKCPRLLEGFGGDPAQPDRVDRATDRAILPEERSTQYFELGFTAFPTLLEQMRYSYSDPKYQSVADKSKLFDVAMTLTSFGSVDSFFEFFASILDQVALLMDTDGDVFMEKYEKYKTSLSQVLDHDPFLKACKQKKIDELLSDPKYNAVDKNVLFDTVLSLRNAGEDTQQFLDLADQVLARMLVNPQFPKDVRKWRNNLPAGHQENRNTFFQAYGAAVPAT